MELADEPPVSADPAREIVSTRDFASPRAAVFEAFRDPHRLARWWGPAGFSNEIHVFDLRPGGVWRFTMTGPDGTAYPNESRFIYVEPPDRIAFVHELPVHRFRMTMTFEDLAGRTHLTWRMLFESVFDADRVRPFVSEANEQNFDRLQHHLQREP
jgi:uncharacterized protein YndB with AHSA1/START domain